MANYYDAEDSEWPHELRDELQVSGGVRKRAVVSCCMFSRRCALEYCGYLEFLRLCREPEKALFVDMSDARSRSRDLILATSLAHAETLFNALQDRLLLDNDILAQDRRNWDALVAQNAPMRVLQSRGLTSQRIDWFDPAILTHIGDEFRGAHEVVSEALDSIDRQAEHMQGNNDLFYFARLKRLEDAGRLEWMGSPDFMREAHVRRRPQ